MALRRLILPSGCEVFLEPFVRPRRERAATLDPVKKLPVVNHDRRQAGATNSALAAELFCVLEKLRFESHRAMNLRVVDETAGCVPHLSTVNLPRDESRGVGQIAGMENVAARIKERLADLDISEREAERRAGLGEGYIRNIKRNRSRTHLDGKFEALARDGLQCSAIWLRTGKGDKSLAGDAEYDQRLRFVLETFDSLDEQEQQAVETVLRSYLNRRQAS